MNLFEKVLSVPSEELSFELRGPCEVPWSDFLLNPRRLRGSDFLMRWSQGQWSEDRLIQAVNETGKYFALPYGPSGTAPEGIREFELYFERLEKAGLGKLKRPDLLLFRKGDHESLQEVIQRIGGTAELPFTAEDHPQMSRLLSMAFLAVECENSLWRAKKMPDYGSDLKPQRRLDGQLGLKKSAVVPTVIIKEEDRAPLKDWQKKRDIPVHIWHVFFDMAIGIAFDAVEDLIESRKIVATEQVFQAPGGATTRKSIYKIYYHYAYDLGSARSEPTLVADYVDDKNGHILPYVRFHGGVLQISVKALEILESSAKTRRQV
jgi:hypothetical protein